MIFKSASI